MWKRTAYVIVGLTALAAIIAVASQHFGVDRTVTIYYEQRGQCNTYVEGLRTVGADQGAFVVFKITRIVNRAKNAVDFDFDPERLHISNSQPKDYLNQPFSPLAPLKAPLLTVKRGDARDVNGFAITIVEAGGADPSAVAVQTNYRLATDQPLKPGQDIELHKIGTGPPWGNAHTNCALIHF